MYIAPVCNNFRLDENGNEMYNPRPKIYQFSDLSCPNRKLLQIGTKYVMLASPNYLSVTMRRFPLLSECFALIRESFALLCVYYTKVWRDSRKALVITRNFRINSRKFLVIIRKFSVITQQFHVNLRNFRVTRNFRLNSRKFIVIIRKFHVNWRNYIF